MKKFKDFKKQIIRYINKNMNEIFLDTETTGLSFKDGHKIVEIACIETKDLVTTGKVFHKLINPNRNIPDEAFKIVSNDSNVKDEIAAGLYYKDIGSRKGLTVAQSNVEYEAASDNIKIVYRSKAVTDIRKLVTEGYIKISRQTQDVTIATEKATL